MMQLKSNGLKSVRINIQINTKCQTPFIFIYILKFQQVSFSQFLLIKQLFIFCWIKYQMMHFFNDFACQCMVRFFFGLATLAWCILFLPTKNLFLPQVLGHNQFFTIFYSMKMTESEKIVLVSRIIDFDDLQVSLRLFSFNLNSFKVTKAFLRFSGQILKKTIITLQAKSDF